MDALAPGGEGVGRQESGAESGRVVFVAGGAPGDRVMVRLTQTKPRWARGELVEVLAPGSARVEPFCPIRAECGGCAWQHVALDAQRAAKQAMVQRIADRLAAPPAAPVVVPPVVAGGDRAWRHRARVRFAVEGGVTLGFLGSRSHRLVDVPSCPVLQPPVRAAMDALRGALEAAPAGARGTAVLSAGAGGGAFASVRLEGAPGAPLAAALAVSLAGVVVLAPDGEHRSGEARLEVPGAPGLRVRPGGFTQANPEVFALLVRDVAGDVERIVASLVGGTPGSATSGGVAPLALDLFAGAGTLSLPLAVRVPRLLALEGSEEAVHDLRSNLEALAPARPEARAAHCDLSIPGALRELVDAADLVVLDPPREGAAPLIEDLAALSPAAIIYVSCDPQTQARDLVALGPAWRLESLRAYDAFPHTPHVETVAVLRRPDPRR